MSTEEKVTSADLMQILRDRLMMAHYPLGGKLRPATIAEEFDLSASSARELMLRLAGEGLLQYEDQRGFRVTKESRQGLNDIVEFRILLEQEGASRSIEQGGIRWEADLTAAHYKLHYIEQQLANAADPVHLLKPCNAAELDFHQALIGAANMPVLQKTFRYIYALFRQQIVDPHGEFWADPLNFQEHARILDAALDRDQEACRSAIYGHLKRHLIRD